MFKLLWHRDRNFELICDPVRGTLRFPAVLPEVPAGSPMYSDFQEFVKSRFSDDVPGHRRIDRQKVAIRTGNRKGDISLTAAVRDDDYEYATRKLVNLVHEVYLVFLNEGRYYEYLVKTFDLDPDHM